MNSADTVPLMLLALHMLALGVIAVIFLVMIVLHRRARVWQQTAQPNGSLPLTDLKNTLCPFVWVAIRSSNPEAVQAALGMNYPAPCPWTEGISGEHEFFIGAPVNKWVVVTGSSLPHPGCDVDRCFYFLIHLSRVLGHVQLFMADPVLHHHAWIRVENSNVKRAYAWAGKTVWNQGPKSLAEIELNMKCFGYGEENSVNATMEENAAVNVKRVSSLAARWSIDPLAMDGNLKSHADGIAGKSSFFIQD